MKKVLRKLDGKKQQYDFSESNHVNLIVAFAMFGLFSELIIAYIVNCILN
jgi:hypothetical protein